MTIEDLIRHHEVGAQACRAYADTPNASDPKTKDIAKHYERRALWHEDAIKLLEGLRAGCEKQVGKECEKGRKPIPLVAPTPPPPNKETSRLVMFQRVPAGQEPDPNKWEALGHATIKPIPATDP